MNDVPSTSVRVPASIGEALRTGSDAQGQRRSGTDVVWWCFLSLQHPPLGRLGFGVGGYYGGGEPRVWSPWPPLPLIVLRDRGPPTF
jgi:hypothetical protein